MDNRNIVVEPMYRQFRRRVHVLLQMEHLRTPVMENNDWIIGAFLAGYTPWEFVSVCISENLIPDAV